MRALVAGLAVVTLVAGCCSPTSTGWTFQVHRPPTVNGVSIVQPQGTTYGGFPLGAGPLMSEVGPFGPVAPSGGLYAAPSPYVRERREPTCPTLQDMNLRLDALQRSIERMVPQKVEPLPCPKRCRHETAASPVSGNTN